MARRTASGLYFSDSLAEYVTMLHEMRRGDEDLLFLKWDVGTKLLLQVGVHKPSVADVIRSTVTLLVEEYPDQPGFIEITRGTADGEVD